MSKEELLKRVAATLDKVRPYLQADGGDIEVVELTDDNVLKVRLTGACHGCPYSMQTLKAGVEQAIKSDIPEIKEVVAA
ncbi:MAG: NifU family protein [Marinilabiliales bacterium]|nr:MAG: NifU family protein [Marinilabiliales bacterium]